MVEQKIELSDGVTNHCKDQLKKGCGTCVIHSVCATIHPITRHHLNNWIETINNTFEVFKKSSPPK